GDPNTTKYEYFRSGSDKSGAFAPTSLTDPISIPKPSILRRIVDYFSIEKPAATPLSPNVNADGPPLSKPDSAHAVIDDLDNSLGYIDGKPMPTPDHLKTFNPGETLPSGDKAGKGPGAASLSEYIETTLTKSEVISQGRLGFDPAFESKGAAESGMVGLSKSGLEAFRVLREAGIRVSVGSEATWGELNAAGSHFINEVFNSPTRTNKLTTTSDGTRFLDITDNKGRTVRATEKGDFVGFIVDRPEALPQWNPKALPPSRAGPQSKTNFQILVSRNRVKYTPINPGPLPKEIASTFRSATYEAVKLDQPAELYRVFSDPSKKMGPYWTIKKPESSLKAIVDNALDPNWGNRATDIVSIRVPAGETIYVGPSASQRALVGGVDQIYIDQVNPLWEIKQ
ncbi:MAG TPA: hypothetical protein PKX64_04205, partial [Elusimicrobiota bacterium]|nr:hypothetical protein [Elusimicrobiota bacterium]